MRVEVKIEIGGSLFHVSEYGKNTILTGAAGSPVRDLELDIRTLAGLWASVRADADAWMDERGNRGVHG